MNKSLKLIFVISTPFWIAGAVYAAHNTAVTSPASNPSSSSSNSSIVPSMLPTANPASGSSNSGTTVSPSPESLSPSITEPATGTPPVLRDYIPKNTPSTFSSTTPDNSVESYFQIHPQAQAKEKKSLLLEAPETGYKIIWHVLDNLGVPMFFYKGNDLDPSLRGNTSVSDIVSPRLPSEHELIKQSKNGTPAEVTAPSPTEPESTGTDLQKIPESELNGTIYEAPHDEP